MPTNNHERELQVKLIQLVQSAVEQDELLRTKHQINDKFRFIRDRLHTVIKRLENELQGGVGSEEQKTKSALLSDEVLVYVYLYNSKGVILSSWHNMLTPKVFYEYSVNRPIYAEKSYAEALVKQKSNKTQHAYLTIAVKLIDMTKQSSEMAVKDNLGNPVIKVRVLCISASCLLLPIMTRIIF
jgi:hypothetical protein